MKADLNVLDCLCRNLRKTSRLLTNFYDGALRPSGIRITQFTLLAAIKELDEATFIPLADFLGMDRTTLTKNLDLLQRDGYVHVRSGERDRRQRALQEG